jgi:hypothetical protein
VRFLVLPRVAVPHLASHMLATLARRIRADWHRLGSTQGRTRNDRNHCIRAAIKDGYC